MRKGEIIKQLRYYYQVYITDESIALFHKYLSKMPRGAKVLEIGTGWGKSATAMAMCNPHIQIETLDTGEFQIACGWAKNQKDYLRKVKIEMRKFKIKNVEVKLDDWVTYKPEGKYDAIHLDSIASLDASMLLKYLHYLKPGGIFFVRNYFRFKKHADVILKDCKFLEHKGFLQVVRK
jgi:predicted O-methyltransferase YrrM